LPRRQPQFPPCRSPRLLFLRQTRNRSVTFVTNGAAAGGGQTTIDPTVTVTDTAIGTAATTMTDLAIIDDRTAIMAVSPTGAATAAGIAVGTTTTTDEVADTKDPPAKPSRFNWRSC